MLPNRNAGDHLRPKPDKRAFTDSHTSRQRHGRTDVGCHANLAFMVDDSRGIDNRRIVDGCLCADVIAPAAITTFCPIFSLLDTQAVG